MYDDDRKDINGRNDSQESWQAPGRDEYIEHKTVEQERAAGVNRTEDTNRAADTEQNAASGGWSQRESDVGSSNSNGSFNGSYNSSYNSGQDSYHRDAWEQNGRMNMSHIPLEREKTSRKKSSTAAKVAGVAAAALLFGTVAGGTMFGVNTLGEYVKSQYAPQESESQVSVTVGQAETEGSASTSAGAPVTAAIQMDVSSIVEKAMPSVVAINNTMLMQQQTWFGPTQTVEVPSSGSGIIVGQNDEELLIVTNNHVVEDSKTLTVTFIDNEQVQAAIKGTDSDSDLAVIAIKLADIPSDTMSQIKVATLGDSDSLKVGEGVIAIGNALGYGQSVTVGYVSALNREVTAEDTTSRNLLQTDAAINPGNSGGALLNMKGEVIGINAAKYSSTAVEGMGYAIPISQAQDIINELMNKRTRVAVDVSKQGYLGIQGQNIDETAASMYGMPRGIYVYKIVEDSAASQSDLREKDIITKFDGQTVRTMADLKDMLTYYEGGDTVNLTVQSLDNGQYMERTVEITLGKKPAAETN